MRVNLGLPSFMMDPDGAGQSLSELVEFGEGRIPRESWKETEIQLMTMAGLRMLDVQVSKLLNRVGRCCVSLKIDHRMWTQRSKASEAEESLRESSSIEAAMGSSADTLAH